MRDKKGTVIYVGKAKKLRNRVGQYFQDSANHSPKTRKMVSQIHHFDVIVAESEFEALVLECSLIKRYAPKYNILLKDDKGYPYLRIDLREDYPKITMSNRAENDGASYFGPFGGRNVTQQLIDTIRLTFKLPGCSQNLASCQGKNRPCLNYHMGNCDGWCQLGKTASAYKQKIEQVVLLLRGKYKEISNSLRAQMEEAAEQLKFERAAMLRDHLLAVENLGKKQLVTAGAMSHTDVVGYYEGVAKVCFLVLHYADGNLLDKSFEIFPASQIGEEMFSSLVKQYYLSRNCIPKEILLPFNMDDAELFSDLLLEHFKKRVRIKKPIRGDGAAYVNLAMKNAKEEALRATSGEEHISGTLRLLQNSLGLANVPRRIESFDISNTSDSDIVASMVVFLDGKPHKQDYKRFRVDGLSGQDDYGAMRQVIIRRFIRYINGETGFSCKPDLILVDGGIAHAQTAVRALCSIGLTFPVYGMVKDHRHRTRALVTPDGDEIGIQTKQTIYSLIGTIQEETHRFAIAYHRQLRSKHMRASVLDQIPGIGPARKKVLLTHFRSVRAVEIASEQELEEVLPTKQAHAVYCFFHKEGR